MAPRSASILYNETMGAPVSREVHVFHRVDGENPRVQFFNCRCCDRRLPESSFPLAMGRTRKLFLPPDKRIRGGTVHFLRPDCIQCIGMRATKVSKHPLWTPDLHRFIRGLVQRAAAGVRRRGMVCAITEVDVLEKFYEQEGRCALSGREMALVVGMGGRGGKNRLALSIDRIDSWGNYTRDNIQLVCAALNLMKGDLSSDEFRYWCAQVVLHNAEDDDDDD